MGEQAVDAVLGHGQLGVVVIVRWMPMPLAKAANLTEAFRDEPMTVAACGPLESRPVDFK